MSLTYNKKIAIFVSTAIFFVIVDRFLKNLALFYSDQNFPLYKDLLGFHLAKNEFIAFSIPVTGFVLNIFITAIILAGLAYIIYGLKKELPYIALLVIIIAGATSNLFDRLYYGYVIDYIDLKYFTVFNIADVMIVVGSFLFLFLLTKKAT